MALSKTEFRRRLIAALELNGKKLGDLEGPLVAHGLPKHAAARVGHESDQSMPSRALILALAEILEVPPSWFEADDWRSLLTGGASAEADLAELLHALRSDVQAQDLAATRERAELRTALESVRSHLGLDDDAQERRNG